VSGAQGSRTGLLYGYLAAQLAAAVGLLFVPVGTLAHGLWQSAMGWAAAVFVVVGMRRLRPRGAVVWYILAAGLAINACGVTVEWFSQTHVRPQLADAFWLAIYPAFIVAFGLLVYRRSVGEDSATLTLTTAGAVVVTLFLGIFAWEFLVWQPSSASLDPGTRIVIAYPLCDFMVIPLILRLFMTGAARSPALCLLSGSYVVLLLGDLSWASYTRRGVSPSAVAQQVIEMISMFGFVLLGASALHPSVQEVVPPLDPAAHRRRLSWVLLALATLTPPVLMLVEVLLDFAFVRLLT
jgi:hypothetical protein